MKSILTVACAAAFALALGGCASPENQYFTLSRAEGLAPVSGPSGRLLTIYEVDIPGYLDKPQIVVKTDPDRADIREYERWAEPLDTMIRRVLLADLTEILGDDRVALMPSKTVTRVVVSIFEFGEQSHRAVLRGAWSRAAPNGDSLSSKERRFNFEAPIEGPGMGSSVAALSDLIGRLSKDIAANP